MLGDLWAYLQIPAGMNAGQARAWLQASEQEEATPESVQEIVELSASMEDFEFVPDPNAHLGVMGGVALRISELLLPRPWWIAEYDSPALLTSDEPVGLRRRLTGSVRGRGGLLAGAVVGRPRGHLDDGKRQIARTMYEAVDADGKRPDAVADLARHVGSPGRVAPRVTGSAVATSWP